MPYSPPCGDYEHSSVVGPCSCVREDVRVEKKYESESGVLDTGLDGDGPSVLIWQFEEGTCRETDAEGKEVMQEHYEENVLYRLHEYVEVALEDDYHHGDEHYD